MEFRRGTVAEFEVRFGRMASDHAREVGAFGGRKFLPSLASYAALEAAGSMVLFVAYEGAQPAGYQAFIVTRHPHYAQTWAQADAVYLAPQYRKGWAGIDFMRWADEQLRAAGVDVVMRGATARLDIGPALKRMGYAPGETTYLKEL